MFARFVSQTSRSGCRSCREFIGRSCSSHNRSSSKHPEVEVKSEIVLPIKQQLLGNPATKITKILSHPQALAQSQQFLETHYPNVPLVATESTTAAAMYVAEHPKEDAAAIASLETAQHVGLEILAENIQDNELNQTRFWIVGDQR